MKLNDLYDGCQQMAIRFFIIFLCVLAVAACSAKINGDLVQAELDNGDLAKPSYKIGPGDQLQIFVWGNPELTKDVLVRPDGKITTPLVEDVEASGMTPTELARALEEKLAKYIKSPTVTVTVAQFVGRYSEQIRIIGEATNPQSLPYRDQMTLLDVMIAVGGLTEFAAGNRAYLIRKNDGQEKKYQLRLDDLYRNGDISANIKMLPGDVLIIPETWF